jgi:amidase
VVPISHTQDTVGPHARTVRDAALVLSAIAESGTDYSAGLDAAALKGARIGVARQFHTGHNEHTDYTFEEALHVLRDCGAELVENVEIPGEKELRDNFEDTERRAERIVMEFEINAGLAKYLAGRPSAMVRTLADVVRFNQEHAAQEMPYFRQELFDAAVARGSLDDPLYRRALDFDLAFARGFEEFLKGFDALVAPTNAPAWVIDLLNGDRGVGGGSSSQPAAVGGFPLLTVPAGFVYDVLPIGMTFMGPPSSEARLVGLAFAFEQATHVRRAPRFRPTTTDLP